MRRKINKKDKNIQNKINTSTTSTNTTFLLQYKHGKNNDIQSNKESPNTDCAKITSNNNNKNVIIETAACRITIQITMTIYQFHETLVKKSKRKVFETR